MLYCSTLLGSQGQRIPISKFIISVVAGLREPDVVTIRMGRTQAENDSNFSSALSFSKSAARLHDQGTT